VAASVQGRASLESNMTFMHADSQLNYRIFQEYVGNFVKFKNFQSLKRLFTPLCLFFFFLFVRAFLGCATQGDSNVTGIWRFIERIDIYKLRASPAADMICVALGDLERVARLARQRGKMRRICNLNLMDIV
jgi:hypothetical protein